MAATGYTPIQLYRTATGSAVPSAGNMADGELAINTNDGKLFYKNSSGVVTTMADSSGSTVAPGTSGNVLTSTGSAWASSAPAAAGVGYIAKTASYTTANLEGVLADTTGGAFTVTLPASPSLGDQVIIADAGGAFGTNNLTTGRNGSTIDGTAADLVLDIDSVSVQFVYSGTTWEVYAQVGGNGGDAVTLTGTQTLTNKTITYADNTLTGVASLGANTFTGTQIIPAVKITTGAGASKVLTSDAAGYATWETGAGLTTESTSGATQAINFSSDKIHLSTADAATVTYSFASPAAVAKVDLVIDYTAITVFDLANASYDGISFSVAAQDISPQGIFFKPDGTKMYMFGNENDVTYQYTLSTAWDLSTASYDSVSFDLSAQGTVVMDGFFNDVGTKMYAVHRNVQKISQYTLSTAWDLSTASYDSISFDNSSQDLTVQGIFFKSDGTKMYLAGNTNDKIFQYTLSTAWALNTASYDSISFSVASQDSLPHGVSFKSDGTEMYVVGTTNKKISQYALSTAWDLSTASYDSISFSVAAQDTSPQGIFFKADGAKMYMAGTTGQSLYQYTAGTGATIVFPAALEQPAIPLIVAQKTAVTIVTADSGTSYQVISTLGGIV